MQSRNTFGIVLRKKLRYCNGQASGCLPRGLVCSVITGVKQSYKAAKGKGLSAEPHALFKYPLPDVSKGPGDGTGAGLHTGSGGPSYGRRRSDELVKQTDNQSVGSRGIDWRGASLEERAQGGRTSQEDCIVDGKLSLYQENDNVRDILEIQVT